MLTLKLKAKIDPADEAVLKETRDVYTDSFNRVVNVGWESKVSQTQLHHLTYSNEKLSGLPSALVQSARTKAYEAIKSARTILKKGGKANKPFSYKCSVRYDRRTATIDLLKCTASLASLDGRKRFEFVVCDYHEDFAHLPVKSCELSWSKDGQAYLHVVIDVPSKEFVPNNQFVGVDLGENRILVDSNAKFYGKPEWQVHEKRLLSQKRNLQSKGTRSAKRKLKSLSGKVNGFKRDCDHVVSKQLVQSLASGTVVVMEDLTKIRKSKRKTKESRRRLHSWSFARLRDFIVYKAELVGIQVILVNPAFTSQTCSKCGHCEKANRNGKRFTCKKCGYQLDADLNAARNTCERGMSMFATASVGRVRKDTNHSVNRPNERSRQTKLNALVPLPVGQLDG